MDKAIKVLVEHEVGRQAMEEALKKSLNLRAVNSGVALQSFVKEEAEKSLTEAEGAFSRTH